MPPCNCGGQSQPVAYRSASGNPVGGSTAPDPVKSKPPPVITRGRARFTLTTPDNREQVFGSRLEAQAALIRSGGKGTIRPV